MVVFAPLFWLQSTKTLPPRTLKDFIDYAKKNPGKATLGHAGVGSASHLCALNLMDRLGLQMEGVSYRGTGPAMNALVAGQVDYMCDQIVNAVPQINAGTIKAYAVATPERNPSLPDVPTTTEAGLPAFQAQAWNAIFAPKGTSPAIIATLNAAAIWLGLWFAERLSRPIGRLAEASEQVGEGNLDVQVPEPDTGDEIQVLFELQARVLPDASKP